LDRYTVQLAVMNDLEEIANILESAYEPTRLLLSRPPGVLIETREMLRKRIGENRVYKILAQRGSGTGSAEIVGTFDIAIEESGTAWFSHFALRPDLQREGLGHDIMSRAMRIAREAGAKMMELEIYEKANHLLVFYEKHGFSKVSEEEIRGEKILVLSKHLTLEREEKQGRNSPVSEGGNSEKLQR